jgi:hypothetical protein
MKEFRFISGTKVRQACIEHDWFTCGDNDAYNDLFEFIGNLTRKGQHVSVEKLKRIAEIIKENSETECCIAEIMFVLNAECCTTCFE